MAMRVSLSSAYDVELTYTALSNWLLGCPSDKTIFTMSQNINPRVIGRLNKELKQLMASPPEGVRFVPVDMGTLTEVQVA
jgi:hypothetical protein